LPCRAEVSDLIFLQKLCHDLDRGFCGGLQISH
jgi:hypothetical protein